MNQCGIGGCGNKHLARGLCIKHYNAWKRGSLKINAARTRRSTPIKCSVVDCERTAESRDLCNTHYERWRISGSTQDPIRRLESDHHGWVGDRAKYSTVHSRLNRHRGKASTHRCCQCPSLAESWAYDHADPSENFNERDQPFSTNLDHYLPMCWPCHNEFDRNQKLSQSAGASTISKDKN